MKAEPPPVDPEILCRDQLTTEVTLHGEKFAPIPIDIPNAPKAALPTITLLRGHELDGSRASGSDEVIYGGDPSKPPMNTRGADGKPLLFWRSQTEMQFIVNQALELGMSGKKGMLAPGVWDVQITNANGHSAESKQSLAVVDKPAFAKFTPGIVCLDQGDRTIALTGESLLRNGEDKAVLEVDGVDTPFAVDLADCTKVAHAGIDAELCNSANVTLAKGSIQPGFPALDVHNPKTAACKSTDDRKLRIVPAPMLSKVTPPLGCVTEEDKSFTIEGSDFVTVDGAKPHVTIGMKDIQVDSLGGCEDVETQGNMVQRCSSIQITVKKGELNPDLYAVNVVNPDPAGCDNTAQGALRIVPPPALMSVEPPLVCVDDGDRIVTVNGSDFLVVDSKVPAVQVNGQTLDPSAVAPQSCSDLPVPGLSVQKCSGLALTLAKDSVMQGMAEIQVTNPAPADCSDKRSDLLTVVKGPTIASAQPALLCTDDGSKPVMITGTGFLAVGGALPAVSIGGMAVASVDSVGGCSMLMVNGLMVQSCTTLDVTVAKDALMTGRPEVQVQNPDPAGCTATRSDVLTVPPALMIASSTPMNVCQNTSSTAFPISLMGQGFMRVGGSDFTLTFDGTQVTPSNIGGCTALDVAGATGVSSCSSIDFSVDLTGKTATVGMLPIAVSDANVPACAVSTMTALNVVAPPTVTGIDIVNQSVDTAVCSDISFSVNLTGTGFVAGTTVTFANSDGKSVMATDVTVTSTTQLTATFANGIRFDATDPIFDLTVATAAGCGTTEANVLTVNPTPLVFFVDPPIAYNAISVDATVFTSGLSATSTLGKIELVGPDSATTATQLTVVSNPKPNRIVAHIPGIDSGTSMPTFAAGKYAVRVTSMLGCAGELPGGLTETATTDNSLVSAIAPSFVSHTEPTAVTITGAGLMAGPRVYLSPASSSGTAQALRDVVFVSATQVTAVVPNGLTAGVYNLIVVNSDGKVGVLSNGVTVMGVEPPVIDNVVPASLPSNDASQTAVTISGQNFNVASVALECKAPGSSTITEVAGTICNNTTAPCTLTPTATAVQARFSPSVADGSVCLLKLTNTDNSFFEYSAVSISNSSGNLPTNWAAATNMTKGRRALSLVAGRPTATSRFVYAIGGDNGASGAATTIGSTVFNDAEAANVDVFGTMGAWGLQSRTLLPAPRTWAGAATIGRFIYLVGGTNGTSAQNTLYRSQILDPLATSEVTDLDATLSDGTVGLGGGLYYYGVAAIFPSNDPSNPSGESLTGELLPVQLPDRPEKIQLTLSWSPVAGAHGYRIYRSPTPGANVDSLQQLGPDKTCGSTATDICDCSTTPADCQLQDSGNLALMANGPLPAGSLGAWHAVDGARCTSGDCLLGTAREALTTVAVKKPGGSGDYYLYAIGGRDGSGTYLDSYEVATVTVASNGTQTVADFRTGGTTMSSPRAELGAWVLSAQNSKTIRTSGSPDDVWFYLGGGRTTSGTLTGVVQAGQLQSNGDIGASLTTVTALKGSGIVAGFGAGASNDHLYVFGGDPGNAIGKSADPTSTLPTLPANSWNDLGSAHASSEYMGTTQESAFYFLAGGWFNGATLSSTQTTVQ